MESIPVAQRGEGPGVEAPCWLACAFAENCQLEASTLGPSPRGFRLFALSALQGTLHVFFASSRLRVYLFSYSWHLSAVECPRGLQEK